MDTVILKGPSRNRSLLKQHANCSAEVRDKSKRKQLIMVGNVKAYLLFLRLLPYM